MADCSTEERVLMCVCSDSHRTQAETKQLQRKLTPGVHLVEQQNQPVTCHGTCLCNVGVLGLYSGINLSLWQSNSHSATQ